MKKTKRIFLGLVTLFLTASAYASFWDWSTPYRGPDQDIITLVICSNYTKPRLLADLIQDETKQPYILLPATPEGKIFFCPARRKPSLEILESDLARFIKFTNPKQIIVLGNSSYVPEKYLKMIDPDQTVIIIQNKNWKKTAERLGKLLGSTNLSYDYNRLSNEIESGQLYKPTTMNGTPQPQPIAIADETTIIADEKGNIMAEEEIITIEDSPVKDGSEGGIITDEKVPEISLPGSEPVLIEDKGAK